MIYPLLLDITAAVLGFFAAYSARSTLPLPPIQPLAFYGTFLLFSAAALPASFFLFGLYRSGRIIFSISYLVYFLKALFFWGALLAAFSFFSKTDYSRIVLVFYFASAAALAYALRFVLVAVSMRHRAPRRDAEISRAVEDLVRHLDAARDPLSVLEGVRLEREPSGAYRAAKRMLDVLFASAGLLATLPFYPVIMYCIKKDSPGRALIAQERVGKDGKTFVIYKFRTMHWDAPLYALSPRGGGDGRITRVGRVLRKYSIDELPQFWNVLRGEMSVVGPRPEMPFLAARYNEWQKARLSVLPGITGLWQILGRKDLPLEENIEYDIYYVYNQSFFLDLAIILKTIPHLVLPKGAY